MKNYAIRTFKYGTITRIEEESLPDGASSDSLNWMTKGDKIELRRGMYPLGAKVSGSGRITGLKVASRVDGIKIPFFSYGRKLKYYDSDLDDVVEIGSDILPVDASGENVSMDEYHSLAGSFLYVSSPNSSIYKIPVANPDSVVDQLSTDFKGYIRIKQGRMFLWNRKDLSGGFDKTGLYGSYIDHDELSDYTAVTSESVGTGDGSTKTFTGTLSFKAGGPKRTCMYVSITDGVETFRDDRNGVLVGSLGGTGTINYATGDYSVTFNTAPVSSQAITADYYWEDATSQGICDFSKSTPRTAGQGFVFRQDDGGGEFKNLGSIGDAEYCLHTKKTWKLTLTGDDTAATNLIYRQKVGIPNFRAMAETGDGIPYIDNSDINNPVIRILSLAQGSTEIIPISISDNIDLTEYDFTNSVLFSWGNYICVACQSVGQTFNDTFFIYNKIWKSWDRLDYFVSALDSYDGTLLGGDSISNNVYTLFSGVDDDDSEIINYWNSGRSNLGINGMKKVKRMLVEGEIGPDQSIEVYLSLDNRPFVLYETISGGGNYVDKTQKIDVGSLIVGSGKVGGSTTGAITAYHYEYDFRINTDRFEYVKVKFSATNIGYASVSRYEFRDIRYKGGKSPTQYQ